MKKDELIEKFKKEMPEFTGTEEEKEIKKALYVYIELAKMKSFDERYFFGNILSVSKTMTQARREKKNLDKIAGKKKLICVTLSYLYAAILNDLGIQCEVIREDAENVHLNNLIRLKSGRRISADVQLELYRIQSKLTLKHFKPIGEQFIDFDKLTNMLIELGYIKDENDYKDADVGKLQKELEDEKSIDALDKVLSSKEIYGGLKGMEPSEAYKYYYSVIKTILGRSRLGKYYQFACEVRKKNKPTNKYTFCIYIDTGDCRTIKPYFYSIKEGRLIPCDLERLEDLEREGLHLDLYSGARKLKKYRMDKKKFMERNNQEEIDER